MLANNNIESYNTGKMQEIEVEEFSISFLFRIIKFLTKFITKKSMSC